MLLLLLEGSWKANTGSVPSSEHPSQAYLQIETWTGTRLVWMGLTEEGCTNVKECSHMQLWAVIRSTVTMEGWKSLAYAGRDQGETDLLSGMMSLLQGDWYFCWTRLENSGRNFSFAPISNFFHQRFSRTEVYWCLKSSWRWFFLSGCFRCMQYTVTILPETCWMGWILEIRMLSHR